MFQWVRQPKDGWIPFTNHDKTRFSVPPSHRLEVFLFLAVCGFFGEAFPALTPAVRCERLGLGSVSSKDWIKGNFKPYSVTGALVELGTSTLALERSFSLGAFNFTLSVDSLITIGQYPNTLRPT